MKSLIVFITLIYSFNLMAQSNCGNESINGNHHWVNPENYVLQVSQLTPDFIGKNCEIQFVSNPQMGSKTMDFGYASFNPELVISNNMMSFDFSMDFKQLLNDIQEGETVRFYDLTSSNVIIDQEVGFNFYIEIGKVLLLDGASYVWNISVYWMSLNDSTKPVMVESFWFDQSVNSGMVHFNVLWSGNNNNGGSTTITMDSSLKNQTGDIVMFYLSNDPNIQDPDEFYRDLSFKSPYYTEGLVPTSMELGILSSSSTLSVGSGVVIAYPY